MSEQTTQDQPLAVRGKTNPFCSECGRRKAASIEDVERGFCPKWWAITDSAAESDCLRVANFRGIVDDVRWKKFGVLNDGFVTLVDLMGDDLAIVDAARQSYGNGTKHTSSPEHLLRFLMRSRHTSPFEMIELKLSVRVPMDCWRQ